MKYSAYENSAYIRWLMSINCSADSHVMVLPTSSLSALNAIYQSEMLQGSIPFPAEVNYALQLLIKYSPRNILPVSLSLRHQST